MELNFELLEERQRLLRKYESAPVDLTATLEQLALLEYHRKRMERVVWQRKATLRDRALKKLEIEPTMAAEFQAARRRLRELRAGIRLIIGEIRLAVRQNEPNAAAQSAPPNPAKPNKRK